MFLQVDFKDFSDIAKEIGVKSVFVRPNGAASVVTAGVPGQQTILIAEAPLALDEAQKAIEGFGFAARSGQWSATLPAIEGLSQASPFVAVVAYRSGEEKPGLWVNAYPAEPTHAQVLKAIFDEFVVNGELPADVSLEEFVRLAVPHVMILSPDELQIFATTP